MGANVGQVGGAATCCCMAAAGGGGSVVVDAPAPDVPEPVSDVPPSDASTGAELIDVPPITPTGTPVPSSQPQAQSPVPLPEEQPTPTPTEPPAPPDTVDATATAGVTPSERASLGQQAVEIGLAKVGSPYVWAGKGPDVFDCSGFTAWVYAQLGITISPGTDPLWNEHPPNVASQDDLQPGDLLWFDNGDGTGHGHVALYTGGGEFVHAANPGQGVLVNKLTDTWYAERYVGATRIV